MFALVGTFLGEPVRLEWTGDRFDGNDAVWDAITERAGLPLPITPSGPTLARPNPLLPGHACCLATAVMTVERIEGNPPRYPEGFGPDDFAVPKGAAA